MRAQVRVLAQDDEIELLKVKHGSGLDIAINSHYLQETHDKQSLHLRESLVCQLFDELSMLVCMQVTGN